MTVKRQLAGSANKSQNRAAAAATNLERLLSATPTVKAKDDAT